MIPKKIHYCWFGRGPKGELFEKCYKSWKKFFPDYEIIEWNEDNFDVNQIDFTKEAYAAKKYAFVSDFARLKILYEEGGIYFDTDVEVLKKFPDDILENGYFAFEREGCMATGLGFAVPKKNKFVKYMMEDYLEKHFSCENNQVIFETCITTNKKSLEKRGYDITKTKQLGNIKIYDPEYFCGFDLYNNAYMISDKTYTVHHYASSWASKNILIKNAIKRKISSIIGTKNYARIRELKNKIVKK